MESEKLKILCVFQHYKPEPFRFPDLCEELVKRGHEVTVLTGIPNYPEGVFYPGYNVKEKLYEEMNGVRVYRSFTIPRKTGVIYRFLNYYSFSLSSVWKVLTNQIKSTDGGKFDVVLANQSSPIMMVRAGLCYKKRHKIKMLMYTMDLWPESLVAGGITKTSLIYKLYHGVSRNIYKQVDYQMVSSRMFIEYLNEHFGIAKNRIEYLPQYAEKLFEAVEHEHNRNQVNLVFAGNIGKIQSVATIVKAARILKDDRRVVFHIVGGGTSLEEVKMLAEGLDNIVFYGRKPLEDMPEFYQMADAMLLTLGPDPVISMTLPGKVQSYMAAGKAIIGAIDGEGRRVIEESKTGFCGKADDENELALNIVKFVESNDKTMMEKNSKRYYQEHFSREKHIDIIEQKLIDLHRESLEAANR